jgi:N-acetylglucosamine-6-phosphate deacetylase
LLWSVAAGRFALVTDAIAAVGLGDGDYALGSVDLEVNDGIARRSDGVLAGSTLTMIQALRNLVELGVTLERAAEAASLTPAGVLGLGDVGRLGIGRRADVVVVDDNLEIERVLVAGETRVAG